MKNITKLGDPYPFVMTVLTTVYGLYYYELRELSFHKFLQIALLVLWSFIAVFAIYDLINILTSKNKVSKKGKETFQKKDDLIFLLSIYSKVIIFLTYYGSFFIYYVLGFFKKGIFWGYLQLVLLGIFIGYHIALKSFTYIEKNLDKTEQRS